MTTKQGEWKRNQIAVDKFQEIFDNKDFYEVEISLHANDKCQCCFSDANRWKGNLHHRNGNKLDFNRTNLIWLCRDCYEKVNGPLKRTSFRATRVTIAGMLSDLTKRPLIPKRFIKKGDPL